MLRRSILRGIGILSVILFIAACGQKQPAGTGETSPSQSAAQSTGGSQPPQTAAASPKYLQTQVVFVTGDVSVFPAAPQATEASAGGNVSAPSSGTPAEIGALLNPDDRIVVGPDSYCEVQFGDLAVTRIQQNSDVVIGSLSPAGAPDGASVALSVGSVVSRVRKTVEGESFEVRTRTVTCGVRGTRFAVSSGGSGDTTLAVSEGTVAVTPPDVKVEELRAQAESVGTEAAQAVDKVTSSLPLVTAGYQVVITPKEADAMNQQVHTVAASVKEAADAPAAEKSQKVAALTRTAETAATTVKTAAPKQNSLDTGAQDLLQHADTMEIKPLPELPPITVAQKSESAAPASQPATAEQNPQPPQSAQPAPATAPAAAPAPTPAPSQPAAQASGSTPPAVAANPAPAASQSVPTTPPAAMSAPPPAPPTTPKVAAVPTGTISLSLNPSDAQVFVNGREVQGRARPEFPAGTAVSIRVQRPGFQTETVNRVIQQGTNTVSLRLQPKPIERVMSLGSSPVVGGAAGSGGLSFFADGDGTLHAVRASGEVVWSVPTANGGNANSIPVAAGPYVAFSGTREFVVLNAADGSVVYRLSLDGSTAHPFGQRAAFARGLFFFPDTSGIRVIDPAKKSVVSRIAIPSGVWMTPTVKDGKLYAVNQQGDFYEIDLSALKIVGKPVSTEALQPVGSSVTLYGQFGVFAGRRGTVVCMNLSSGTPAWQHPIGGSGAAVYSDILADTSGAFVYANGQIFPLSWSDGSPTMDPISGAATPPAVVDRMLLYGTKDGNLAVADPATGSSLYTLALGVEADGRPVIQGRNILVPTATGSVIVVNADGLSAAASSQR